MQAGRIENDQGIEKGLLLDLSNFDEYQEILPLLNGLLEEDPKKRWSFRKILQFYQQFEENEDNENLNSKLIGKFN